MITSYTLGNELLQSHKRGENPTVDFKVYRWQGNVRIRR